MLEWISINAKTYYVANLGNDNNSGTSKMAAWQTIEKVNLTTIAGDSVLFNSNDSWNEKLIPKSNQYFGSYKIGNKPLITGFQTLTGFSDSSNIWSVKAANSVYALNTVLIDGRIRPKGRYPNTGYITFTAPYTDTSITTSLTGKPDYTSAEAVVRDAHYMMNVTTITSQVGGLLKLTPLTYVPAFGGNGYFIQNKVSVLDTLGEWCYDYRTKKLSVYSISSPKVQISTLDTLVSLRSVDNVTFDGLNFAGGNYADISINKSSYIIIQNCSFNNSGAFAITGLSSPHITIRNDSINNSLSNSITLGINAYGIYKCQHVNISNNWIKNTGIFPGMLLYWFEKGVAINSYSDTVTIANNIIDSCGYVGIASAGQKGLIYKNYIDHFCFVLDDGGGIKMGIGAYPTNYNDSSIIRGNIIVNGLGAIAGTLDGGPLSYSSMAPGIYLDQNSRRITIDSNTIYNCYVIGINLNEATNNMVSHNTIYNTMGHGFQITVSDTLSTITHNIIYVPTGTWYHIKVNYSISIKGIDSNYYLGLNLTSQSQPVNKFLIGYYVAPKIYSSLSKWSAATGQDMHSHMNPLETISSTIPELYINPSQKDSTIILGGNWIDAKGSNYSDSISLKPFTSLILYKN